MPVALAKVEHHLRPSFSTQWLRDRLPRWWSQRAANAQLQVQRLRSIAWDLRVRELELTQIGLGAVADRA